MVFVLVQRLRARKFVADDVSRLRPMSECLRRPGYARYGIICRSTFAVPVRYVC